MLFLRRAWCSVLIALLVAPQFAFAISRFQSWFPRYEGGLNYAVENNCSTEFAVWKADQDGTPDEVGPDSVWYHDASTSRLISCILAATPEVVKSNFASAAVILGLMPALLAIVGPSIQETSTLLALGDQPLLAFLLCLGSPLIGLDRRLHIRGAYREVKSEAVNFGLSRKRWLTPIQYVLALASIANIAEVTWELAIKCSYSWFTGDAYLLGVWAFVGFVVHVIGAMVLGSSISLQYDIERTSASPLVLFARWLRWRFSFANRRIHRRVVVQPPTFAYFLFLAFITVLTLIQITLGTLLFSGILFISVKDAVGVFARFLASVIVTRTLVLMELVMVKPLIEMEDAEDYKEIDQSMNGKK